MDLPALIEKINSLSEENFAQEEEGGKIRLALSFWPYEKVRRQIRAQCEEKGWEASFHHNHLTGIWWIRLERKPKEERVE